MIYKVFSTVFIFCLVVSGFAVNQILYLAPPVPGATATNYPQTESTGYFLQMIMRDHLSALAEWEVVTEPPTNTNNALVYRLETSYTLSGPIPRPDCNYIFSFYNESNKLLFQTNIVADIKYGLFDASDVAVFATGRVLGEDLSRYGFLSVVVPGMASIEYELYLNKSRVFILTNTEPQKLEYRLSSSKTNTITLKERPSLKNLYLGSLLWQTNLVLPQGKSETITVNPLTKVSFDSVRTELLFPPVYAYTLMIRRTNEQNPFTNVTLNTRLETNITLPLGQQYSFELIYTPKNLLVSSNTVFLQRPRYTYKPIDKKQPRPLYGALTGGFYILPSMQVGLPPFRRGALTLYYYPTMNLRIGLTGTKDEMIDVLSNATLNLNNISGFSLRFGWYPFTYRYQPLRLVIEGSAGFQSARISIDTDRPDVEKQLISEALSTLMTGWLFEASVDVEFYFLLGGIGVWLAPRQNPVVGTINAWGINLFLGITL
ncbi:hypothetical protein [Thermospira aquatica]|uniref:Uncharacterized protein n=1 Tax=Thermospira aquatica TaxID=2828656 RepID=A0AAX3BE04_9SPIR|nr:hypothetical protein [Thermospira aquatica]URA10398.1 hypothetical protein KDW03_00925 [Thermospira aquatica]